MEPRDFDPEPLLIKWLVLTRALDQSPETIPNIGSSRRRSGLAHPIRDAGVQGTSLGVC